MEEIKATYEPASLEYIVQQHSVALIELRNRIELLEAGKRSQAFKPPTIEEVRAYFLERNNGLDPEVFWHHYNKKGWMVGKSKMKSWHSAVVTFEKDKKPVQPVRVGMSSGSANSIFNQIERCSLENKPIAIQDDFERKVCAKIGVAKLKELFSGPREEFNAAIHEAMKTL